MNWWVVEYYQARRGLIEASVLTMDAVRKWQTMVKQVRRDIDQSVNDVIRQVYHRIRFSIERVLFHIVLVSVRTIDQAYYRLIAQ